MSNNLMKAISIGILMILLLSFAIPTNVYASETSGFWSDFDVKIKEGEGGGVTTGEDTGNQGFAALIGSLKNFIVGIAGVATVIAVGFFIFNFMKLGGSNSRTRSEAISGLIYSGIATAGLGSVTLITAMFYGMIGKGSTPAP